MRNRLLATLFATIILPNVALADISYSGSSTIGTGILKEGGAVSAFEKKSGKITVDHIASTHDVGQVINPLQIRGSVLGGITMAMGAPRIRRVSPTGVKMGSS